MFPKQFQINNLISNILEADIHFHFSDLLPSDTLETNVSHCSCSKN